MTDAEFNSIVGNYIANHCNSLMEKVKPFPSEKVSETATAIYDTMQRLGDLYRGLQDYQNGNEETLIKLK
jgi:hypothetical protein